MIIFVDIDNTICSTDGQDYINSKPLYDRIDVINKIHDAGHDIIYWTARGTCSGIDWYHLTKLQIDGWGCKYDELRMGKPAYDLFIDDKNINSIDFFINEDYNYLQLPLQ